ncbi:MAG: hypothetical protein RLZZ319_853 [Actinomycetota bacterium]
MPTRRHIPLVALAAASALTLSGCTTISTLWSAYELSSKPIPTPTAASHPPTGLVTLAVGDCVDRDALEDGIESTIPVISCASPHDLEVYASITLPDGDYPSVEALTNQGSVECGQRFGEFIGVDFGFSDLDFVYYYPTESSWANGDRGVDCLAFDPTGKSTGTLSGAQR